MTDEWEPGIGSAQIKADSEARRIACGCTFREIEPRGVPGSPAEAIDEIVEPCRMHEDWSRRMTVLPQDRAVRVPVAPLRPNTQTPPRVAPNEPPMGRKGEDSDHVRAYVEDYIDFGVQSGKFASPDDAPSIDAWFETMVETENW